MYRSASAVTFYSRGLHDKALELGLERPGLSVAYPPVVERFAAVDEAARAALRQRLGLTRRHVLVNVKRLHPLAGQRHLLDAMPAVLRAHPDTELVICGTGALRPELEAQAAALGIAAHVRFAGPRRQRDRGRLQPRRGPVRAAVAARSAADRRRRGAGLRHAGRERRPSRRRRAARPVRRPTSRWCRARTAPAWRRRSRCAWRIRGARCRPRRTAWSGISARPRCGRNTSRSTRRWRRCSACGWPPEPGA
jgi:hypothetical protein